MFHMLWITQRVSEFVKFSLDGIRAGFLLFIYRTALAIVFVYKYSFIVFK